MHAIVAAALIIFLYTWGTSTAKKQEQLRIEQGKPKSFTTVIANVTRNMKTIVTMDNNGDTNEYNLADTVEIVDKKGNKVKAEDMKPGKKITIEYEGTRIKPEITRIILQPW